VSTLEKVENSRGTQVVQGNDATSKTIGTQVVDDIVSTLEKSGKSRGTQVVQGNDATSKTIGTQVVHDIVSTLEKSGKKSRESRKCCGSATMLHQQLVAQLRQTKA
jgi:hypothetical protein